MCSCRKAYRRAHRAAPETAYFKALLPDRQTQGTVQRWRFSAAIGRPDPSAYLRFLKSGFGLVAMTSADDIEAVIAEIDRDMRLVRSNLDRLRAMARARKASQRSMHNAAVNERYEVAASAFRRHGFEFDDLKVRRICQRHADQDGFAVKLGKWHVRLPRFDEFAEQVKFGAEQF